MTAGFKTLLMIAAAAVIGLAIAIHLFAPQYMRTIGQAIHGGR